MILLEFSDWDIEPWVIFVDGVVMTCETAVVSEPAAAPGTWNHGSSEGKLRAGGKLEGQGLLTSR